MASVTLITGGLGFVGSHFVWAAAREGRDVVILDDGSAGTSPPLPEGVEVVRADIGDRPTVSALIRRRGVDAIVHFAGKIQVGESVTNPALYFDVNVIRAFALLEEARAAGVPRILFSSTAAVYGEPDAVPIPESAPKRPVNPYGASKLSFEHALEAYGRAYGLRWAALRYFNAAGADPSGKLREAHDPETHLIPLLLDAGLGRRPPLTLFGEDYPTRDGTCERDYIHVVDLASAHLKALDRLAAGHEVGPLNLGTGRGSTVREVLDEAERVLARPIPRAVGPRRAGDPSSLVADPRRAEEILGWRAQRSDLPTLLEDTLRSRT
ncbi:UDP-glucose 4-epimerase GalE [Chondromyces apiculatus]|uniref:UDP-glucose 4-epimerase n=1 Tax=Chondromyces apiculatus DSM 436 TaxID=1192034 RepID=A0A017T2J0_9BACT|nr:UDP-glucose 4-epimerase GalE [Chondromyces apiculatus]EYF03030.1 UDP-glucose 4-epimerase [Chondromyces apiculatus DSM 436]